MADAPPPQDYASLSHLEIVVRATLVLHSTARNMVLGTPNTDVSISRCDLQSDLKVVTLYETCPSVLDQVRVTVSPESTVAQHGGVPWWIILVAVLAGILILALLVYLLWKVSSLFYF